MGAMGHWLLAIGTQLMEQLLITALVNSQQPIANSQ
jgi:hypothetical protein